MKMKKHVCFKIFFLNTSRFVPPQIKMMQVLLILPNPPQVSMLGPSPDWIVGVSGLELCLKNCTWAEEKELFLYPWDAGVDSGISYESPDSPTFPQQKIRRSKQERMFHVFIYVNAPRNCQVD